MLQRSALSHESHTWTTIISHVMIQQEILGALGGGAARQTIVCSVAGDFHARTAEDLPTAAAEVVLQALKPLHLLHNMIVLHQQHQVLLRPGRSCKSCSSPA